MDPNQQPQNQPNQQPEQQPAQPQLGQEQQPPEQPQDQANWHYTSGQLTAEEPTQPEQQPQQFKPDEVLAEWTAQEFIEHDKNSSWYLILGGGALLISAVLYLITREIMSVVVTILLAVVMGIYGSAKPKTVKYVIDSAGISLDGKHYDFASFKSFSVIENSPAAVPYIQLMPQKRLMIPITIFVDPAHSQDVTELIGQFVPYDQKEPDFVDKLAARFRF